MSSPVASRRPAVDASPSASSASPGVDETTRRAMISTAMAGIDRFKRGWVSVMILKSSIGLGQVIVLFVLLILASTLDSPLSPHATQSVPSDACPHPRLFQAWMAVNMVRLAVCWCVSCWMCVRYNRRQRLASHTDIEQPASTAPITTPPLSLPRSDTVPSLSHSSSSTSTSSLAAMSESSRASPATEYAPTMVSNPSTEMLSDSVFDMTNMSQTEKVGHPTLPILISTQAGATTSTYSDLRNLQAARNLREGQPTPEADALPSGVAAWLDRAAPTISKSLGTISAILFVLGNVLVFYPNPMSHTTCYHAAPMLWWGVMTVTAVGWVLLGQVFIVVIVVGLGGQAILALLRRMGVVTPPPEPEPARPPQPDVLTVVELAKIPLVVYLPDPVETASSSVEGMGTIPAPIDPSRLAYPAVYLDSHLSTCAICQEQFNSPKESRTILLKAEPLRQLGCGHVYHMNCIDQWLLEGHGNCPFCNKSVRESWDKESSAAGQPERKRSLFRR